MRDRHTSVPEHFDWASGNRGASTAALVVQSLITLRRGAREVEIDASIINTASDHRLRALFPTDVATHTYMADTPFDAVERAIQLREDNHLYRELEMETKPQQSWTAVM